MTAYMGGRKSLRALRKPDRILITLFAVAIGVAMLVGVLNYYERTHLSVQGTEAWYRGNEEDPNPRELQFPKSTRELLDVTHPHLFFQSIMFFILCHIFSLSQVSDTRKIAIYGVAFATVFTEAALPWLIRFGSALFSPLLIASTVTMAATILILLVVPVREMWSRGQKPPAARRRLRRRTARTLA